MSSTPIQIKRYPNRRYYARNTSKYVSLQDIEQLIQSGQTVEIRDSQTGEDLTRAVLTQIIIERQPEKMLLFPTDMLHCILQSNDLMTGFLRDYFRHSLTYLQYLQQHRAGAAPLAQPMHWIKAWLDSITSGERPPAGGTAAGTGAAAEAESTESSHAAESPPVDEPPPAAAADHDADAAANAAGGELAQRIAELEARLRQLEGKLP